MVWSLGVVKEESSQSLVRTRLPVSVGPSSSTGDPFRKRFGISRTDPTFQSPRRATDLDDSDRCTPESRRTRVATEVSSVLSPGTPSRPPFDQSTDTPGARSVMGVTEGRVRRRRVDEDTLIVRRRRTRHTDYP